MNRTDGEQPPSCRKHAGGEHLAVHGSAKAAEPTDPLDLIGAMVPGGDVDELARCFIEEYAAMGYGSEQILSLFRQPRYLAVHPIYRLKGEEAVRQMIEETLSGCGIFRVSEATTGPRNHRRQPLHIQLPDEAKKEDQRP
ncbi:MAG: hypothetical protein ACE5HV_04875 [Acidobacteriota bacterium]